MMWAWNEESLPVKVLERLCEEIYKQDCVSHLDLSGESLPFSLRSWNDVYHPLTIWKRDRDRFLPFFFFFSVW